MNKTENTPGNKAAFFAHYYGQSVMLSQYSTIINNSPLDPAWAIRASTLEKWPTVDNSILLLKPLSQITDEDAIKFIKMVSPYTGRIEIKERIVGGIVFDCPYVGEQLLFRFKNLAIHKKNTGEEFNQYYTYSPILHLRGIDFLRSKGYLLPWRDLSVDDIISYGWAKYEA